MILITFWAFLNFASVWCWCGVMSLLMLMLIQADVTWNLVSHVVSIVTSAFMMTSSNGNIFRVTGHLCGEFTGHPWILLTKASDAELWCFLWSLIRINGWVNNGEAGDLRRRRAHCDVIVMLPGDTIWHHRSGSMLALTWTNADL